MAVLTDQRKTGIKAIVPRTIQESGAFPATTRIPQTFIGSDPEEGVTFHRSTTNLFISTDYGVTISSGKGLPSGVTNGFSCVKVVRCFDLWWAIYLDAGDSLYKVYSCPIVTGNGALTWTARKTLGSGATNLQGCLNASSDGLTLMVAEYTSNGSTPGVVGGVSIYRTTDGTNFTTPLTHVTGRHWHGVYEDAYAPGTWYAALGDGTETPILRSTDNGVTFAAVSSIPHNWDAVSMSFSPKWIWATGDLTGGTPVGPVYVIDRGTMTPQVASCNTPKTMAVWKPGEFKAGTVTSGSPTLAMSTTEAAWLTTDDIGRHIVVKDTTDGTTLFVGTVSNVSSFTVTLSGNATASSGSGDATYMVARPERYYPFGLNGCVDPDTEIFYLHVDNAGSEPTGSPWRFGLFALFEIGGPWVLLDNVIAASVCTQIYDGYVMSGNNIRPVITAADAIGF